VKELSPQYLFFPQTESQCNRTFPTVWWHLRMRQDFLVSAFALSANCLRLQNLVDVK
jgi:hypothetical protein